MFSLARPSDNKSDNIIIQLALFFILLLPSLKVEAYFQLESTGIIMEESEGRVDFNVTNTSATPILLVSKLHDLDKNSFSKQIIISPPITRINPGKTQQINFILKKGVTLPHEILMKASFEGVGQAKKNSAKMPVRQEIGFLIGLSALTDNKTPWEKLKLTHNGQKLVINNPSQYVVRLAPDIMLLPGNQRIQLKNFYILPQETFSFDITGSPSSAKIIPLSRYGFKMPDVTISVDR